MCGITGFIDYSRRDTDNANAVLNDMTRALRHRGPDASGTWIDEEKRIGLGHTRLSIIDTSNGGAQPMHSASGRYSITFNGEIYGFLDLRRDLIARGVQFRGGSDTEVLLAAIETLGARNALARCNGMFAFALLDRKARKVLFARDRIGKKPLYIGLNDHSLGFASELRSIRRHPAFSSLSIDVEAVTLYARYKYVPTPLTIYREIFKLPPGSYLELSVDECPSSTGALAASTVRYWDLADAARAGRRRHEEEAESLQSLEDILRTCVAERMVADVRLGAFLSGGIDSSLVVAMMQELSAKPVKTFTVRFLEPAVNEADVAKDIATHLKTDHMEITASPEASLELVDSMADVYDEPFADPSQIPTLMVSRLAREHVTVALSGDGGDEAFAGYARYPQMLRIEGLAGKLPAFAFRATAAAPDYLVEGAFQLAKYVLPKRLSDELSADRVKKLAELAAIPDFDRRYLDFLSEWKRPADLVIGGYDSACAPAFNPQLAKAGPVDRMIFKDAMTYLHDDILVKVDRASMSVALEMRAPLLDYRFIEEAWRVPESLCLSGDQGKIALRRLLSRRLPPSLVNQPKRGFGVPMNEWLRNPLRPWAEALLSPARLKGDGVFRPEIVRKRWEEHISGRRNWGSQLWTILMFNEWKSRWA